MTAGCAMCGNCCEDISCADYDWAMKWTSAALDNVPDPATDEGWAYWLEHGWDADKREKAVRRFPLGSRMRADADFMAAHWKVQDNGNYACDAFDPETRLCTAHDSRPPVCRDYPWYGRQPGAEDDGTGIPLGCSYLADLPPDQRPEGSRPLIPLMVA